jgi:hypothetical protein
VTPEPRRSDRSRGRTIVGTIELLAASAVVLAIVAFVVWFFASAHNPLLH